MSLSSHELANRAAQIDWYHRLELPGGVITAGKADTRKALRRLRLPESLAGKTVLDIGTWDGFYAFECARRGAERVLATDSFAWSGECWGTKDGFDLARDALGLQGVVNDQAIDVMDLTPEQIGGQFDVVLLLGVLYHLTDPIRAMERAASCSREWLYIETETAMNWFPFEAARLHPGATLNNDPTNWYQFNVKALRGILAGLGFGSIRVAYHSPMHRRAARAVTMARNGQHFLPHLRSSRIVLHARRTD